MVSEEQGWENISNVVVEYEYSMINSCYIYLDIYDLRQKQLATKLQIFFCDNMVLNISNTV